MSLDALIKFAPIVTAEVLRDSGSIKPGRQLYQRGAMRFLPAVSSVPLQINHDDEREIGVVHELFEHPDTDGLWLAARCTVTSPPAWLRRGTRVSFGFVSLQRHETPDGWQRVMRGIVNEVTVLSPGVEPAESRACVAWIGEASPGRAAAGEVIYGKPGERVIRHGIGQVLGVR